MLKEDYESKMVIKMNLIISIKPQFVERILTGEKKYKFKHRIYKHEVDTIYIYQNLPDAKLLVVSPREKLSRTHIKI